MAITLGTSVTGTAAGVASITLGSVNCTTADCLFVGAGESGGGGYKGVTNVTFNSSSTGWAEKWDLQFSTNFGVNGHYILAPAQTTASCVVTYSAATDEIVAGATPMTGVHQSTPVRTAATNSGNTGTTASVSGVGCSDGDLVMGSIYALNTGPTAQAPATQVWVQAHANGTGGAVSQTSGTSPSVTVGWTVTAGNDWGVGAIAFIPAAEPGPLWRNLKTFAIRPAVFKPGLAR